MMKKILAISVLAATLPAFSAVLHTAKGEVEIKDAPKTVAVFDSGVLDALDALGIKADGITDKIKPAFLAESQKQAKIVGTIFEPDLEALAALNPELSIVATRTAKKYDDVSRVGKTIDLTPEGKDAIAETKQRVADLGALYGKTAEAQKINDELTALANEARELGKGQGKVLGVLVNGPKLSLYGKGSRLGWLENSLGLNMIENKKDDPNAHGNPISFEFIAQENPDWIFVVDRGAAIGQDLTAAETVLDNDLVKNTNAGKNGRIVYLSPVEIYIDVGGPQALKHSLTEVRDALKAHPVK